MTYTHTPLAPFGVCIEPKSNRFPVGALDIAHLRKQFVQHQLLLLRGFETFASTNAFSTYC
jgi:L-tyrosine isonitrile desaturase/decarboxylase